MTSVFSPKIKLKELAIKRITQLEDSSENNHQNKEKHLVLLFRGGKATSKRSEVEVHDNLTGGSGAPMITPQGQVVRSNETGRGIVGVVGRPRAICDTSAASSFSS